MATTDSILNNSAELIKLTKRILESDLVAVQTFPQVWADYIHETEPFIDDVERDFPAVYSDMRHDSRVESNLSVLRMSLVQQGITWEPAVEEEDERFSRALKYRDLVTRQLDSLDRPFEEIAYESTLALPYGHHVSELTWDVKTLDFTEGPQLVIQSIRSLPHETFAFAQDQFNNVLGISPNNPAKPLPIQNNDVVGTLMNNIVRPLRTLGMPRGTKWPIIPLEKFWVQTWQEEFGNKLGRSILRSAYHPWWFKTQVWTAYLMFLAAYASPSVVAIPPKEIGLLRNQAGRPQTKGEVLAEVQKLKNNAAGVLPPGWDIKLLQATSDGAVFRSAIDLCNQEITESILWQILMTSTQNNMTRSAGEVHQDVFDIGSMFLTNWLANGCRRGVARKIVAYNYGEEEAAALTPRPSLGQISLHNFAKFANSVSVLENANWWTQTQRRFWDRAMGVPQARPTEEATRGSRQKMDAGAAPAGKSSGDGPAKQGA